MNATTDAQDQSDMARLADGHGAALDDLMERHSQRLYHYLIRLLRDEAEAADLAQETFVRVFQSRHRFRPGSKFSTWLYTIATNLARDRIRWLSRRKNIPLETKDDGADTGLKNILPSNEPTPREKLETNERAEAVRHALADLPEDLRVPLVLAEYEEQSQVEIAAVLNCSPKAVEMRIYRARQQLRQQLSTWLEKN